MPPRVQVQPGNPLWIEWLEELVQAEADLAKKSADAYRKAAGSLKACPIIYVHPRQAIELQGVGESTVKYLIKRLHTYCDANGEVFPGLPVVQRKVAVKPAGKRKAAAAANEATEEAAEAAKDAKRARLTGLPIGLDLPPPKNPQRPLHAPPTDSDDTDTDVRSRAKPRVSKPRPYVAKLRSGPYAILLGLYESAAEDRSDWHTKQAVIDAAREHTDTPFDAKSGGGSREAGTMVKFDAWSSMAGLCKRSLVEDNGSRPKKYRLTELGYDAAERLAKDAGMPLNAHVDGMRDYAAAIPRAGTSTERYVAPHPSSGRSERAFDLDELIRAATMGSGPVKGCFEYFYLDFAECRTKDRDDADTSQEEVNFNPLYRIEFRADQAAHPIARGVLQQERIVRSVALPGGPTMSGYLRERSSQKVAPGFGAAVALATPRAAVVASLMGNYKAVEKAGKSMYDAPSGVIRTGREISAADLRANAAMARADKVAALPGTAIKPPPPPVRSIESNDYAQAIMASKKAALAPLVSPPLVAPPLIPEPASPVKVPVARRSTSSSNRHPLDVTPPALHYDFAHFSSVTWPAGSFEIILMVDTREKATREEDFVGKLQRVKVVAETRALPLGDFVWIARRSNGGRQEEVVLDSIVERKRLDDLVLSIKDGRYTDQKMRMNHSGIRDKVYLIEQYNTAHLHELSNQQIWTTKSQLQTTDDFYVHVSPNLDGTVQFLKMRTLLLRELYETQDLSVIPDRHIDRGNYVELQQYLRTSSPANNFLTSYASFTALNRPDAELKLSQLWGSMVQTISGIGAEKAAGFVKHWPTPKSFADECESRGFEHEDEMRAVPLGGKKPKSKPEDFISQRTATGSERDIKGAVATKTYKLFMSKKY